MKQLFAYTPPTPRTGYVGFVQLHESGFPDRFRFVVRNHMGDARVSECPLPREDAVRLAQALMPEAVTLQAKLTARAKSMLRLRDTLIHITEDIEDETDRVYFGSTNDAERLKEVTADLDDWHWDTIMGDAKQPDYIGDLSTARQQRDNLAALVRRLIYRHGKGLPLEQALAGANEYLAREKLNGSPLREADEESADAQQDAG